MIPRDHGFGTSFAGVGAYLLHDKGHANTNERVAWTHTHGFATQDADTAFKVMAATAMNQKDIKRQAHEAKMAELPEDERTPFVDRGRKSADSVWHYSLSWHPDEAKDLTKEHMIEAALASLAELGKTKGKQAAENGLAHQAVLVCHDDEAHSHVHVVVNRVHPETGKMISKFDDWRKMSRWAEKYETERGQIYCHQRRANNMARDHGGFVYGKGHQPHHVATAQSVKRNAANDNPTYTEQALADQTAKTAALANKGREMARQHLQGLKDLAKDYAEKRAAIREEAEKRIRTERAQIFAKYQPHQAELLEIHDARIAEFEAREAGVMGRARNMFDAIKATWKVQRAEDRKLRLSDYYRPLADEGARLEAFKMELRAEQRGLEIEREKDIKSAVSPLRQGMTEDRSAARRAYGEARAAMIAEQTQEQELMKAAWAQRSEEREAALEEARLRDKTAGLQPAERFNEASGAPEQPQEREEGDSGDRQSDTAQTGNASPEPSGDVPEALAKARAQYRAVKEQDNSPDVGRDHSPKPDDRGRD